MRVMGIDPGSRKCGWGIVEQNGSRVTHIASGTIATQGTSLTARLVEVACGLRLAVQRFGPAQAAVETVFHAKNSHSALVLGQVRGAALVTVGQADMAVAEYTAGQIKQSVSGYGRADKQQVADMVRLLLGLGDKKMGPDETDALAAAICHAQVMDRPFAALLGQAPLKPKMRA